MKLIMKRGRRYREGRDEGWTIQVRKDYEITQHGDLSFEVFHCKDASGFTNGSSAAIT
jgi:hypothetical protein